MLKTISSQREDELGTLVISARIRGDASPLREGLRLDIVLALSGSWLSESQTFLSLRCTRESYKMQSPRTSAQEA